MENDAEPAASEAVSSVSLSQIECFLKAKDDTSKFVGLALLKVFLDNGNSSHDPEALGRLWEAIPSRFLDRLLRAKRSEKISQQEVKDMIDLAVTVLHAFAILLPAEGKRQKKFVDRTASLLDALVCSSTESATLILQILVSIVSSQEGAGGFLKVKDYSSFIGFTPMHPLALKVFSVAWINASVAPEDVLSVQQSLNTLIPKLLLTFKNTDAVTLLEAFADLLPKLNPAALPGNPEWLPALVLLLRDLVSRKPTVPGRTAYTRLASSLLQVYPRDSPILVFGDTGQKSVDSKPFSYLFINLLLIDLRSSFPSLLTKINSVDYPAISQRLAAAFDVLSSFIGFLIKSMDEEEPLSGFTMPPDLLLRLRKDIAETVSLTIEYLRDRWDASIAGAAGLHGSVRSGTAATSEGTRLTLKWDSLEGDVTKDPLILAGIRGMAIWIREDENDNLRMEAAGLMDMFLELYSHTPEDSDFKYPILLALECILITEYGIENFLAQDGWKILSQDLQAIFKFVCRITVNERLSSTSEAARGVQIIRVLLAVLDHPSVSSPEESWMHAVTLTTSIRVPKENLSSEALEALIASLQLSNALLLKASGGMTKRYITTQPALRGLARQLKDIASTRDDSAESEDFMSLLDEVLMSLNSLGIA